MKQMWSKEEIETQKKDISTLVDSAGNPRFIEGDFTPETINGFTWKYHKWSLSGTHLMIVLAGEVVQNASISENTILAQFYLPKWIGDKIYTLKGDIVTYKSELSVDLLTRTKTFNVQLQKANVFRIFMKSNINWDNVYDSAFRIQFDLLIGAA